MTKSKKRTVAGIVGERGDPSQLIDSMLDRIPMPLDELPASIRATLDEALRQAADGDPELASALVEAMIQAEASAGGESTTEIPRLELCSDAAAKVLAEVDSEDDVERIAAAALEAIAIDPDAVDALVLLGDVTTSREDRAVRYKQASEAAARLDAERVAAVMPFVRIHMAGRLMDDGNVSDAGEILLPALEEDRSDQAGARCYLVEVCLRLGWHDELNDMVDRFAEDELGPIDFARALLSFSRSGSSRRANALLRAAVEKHPYVAEHLVGARPMPREGDRLSVTEHNAAKAAEYLLPGVREIEGAVAWIRETASVSHSEDARFEIDDTSDDELYELGLADPLGVAIDLPTDEVTWQLVVHREKNAGGFIFVLLEDEELIAANHFVNRPGNRGLQDFVLSGVVAPMSGGPRKPLTIRVPTKADVKALEKSCGTYGVSVEQGKLGGKRLSELKPILDMISQQMVTPRAEQVDLSDEALEALPATDETWLYGVFQPPMWVDDGPSPRRTYLGFVTDTENGFMLHHEITESAPRPEEMAASLKSAMVSPSMGQPRRVRRVLLDPESIVPDDHDRIVDQLNHQISGTEIQIGDDRVTSYFSEVVADMLSHNGPARAIKDIEDLDESTLEDFYQIVANFYRAKPWKMVGGDQMFDVACPSWSRSPRTACVIGQLGQELGIAVYDSPSAARQCMIDGDQDLNWQAVVVHYGEEFDTIPVDTWYREKHGWAVAGKEAHPFVARVAGLHTIQCVSAEDVQVLMQILPAVPRFLDHPRDAAMEVDSRLGKVTFQWCDESRL